MKRLSIIILTAFGLLLPALVFGQAKPGEIDSLVAKMRIVHKEWNAYSEALIKIGEPAVPGLIENARDKNLKSWNRRISIITLNNIHSELWVKPALEILFDKDESPATRNQVTGGLSGFDLSGVKTELWDLYKRAENQFFKSNVANLLLTADTSLAYDAFFELYHEQDAHIQRNALRKLVYLRPGESINWYLKAMQGEDWMTANVAMDSLICSKILTEEELGVIYHQPDMNEEIQWRIVYILGKRNKPGSVEILCEALKNESWLVRTEAAVALSLSDIEEVEMELGAMKDNPSEYVRKNVNWIFRRIQKRK